MSKLRIAFATPWNARSAIAQQSSEIVFELAARGHETTILRSEVGEASNREPRPAPGAIRSLAEMSDEAIRNEFDLVVAQFGDNMPFHGAIPSRLDAIEALGIFHDFFIGHLARDCAGSEAGVRALLWDCYGADPTPPGRNYLDDLAFAARYPLLEWLAGKCVAAVAHSGHYVERLRAACPGPVETIPLAMRFSELPPPPAPWETLTVAVIGHANPNKRIDRLILGVGASPRLRARCRIRIIGEATPDMRASLERIAAVAGVAPLQFTGWIPDDELARSLRDVDAICCLRNPVLEGASASLLLAMSSGRPTLVTNHGCYAEAPEDAVLRCAPDHEARDVARHLGRLLDDPTRGADTGKRARAHVSGRLGPVAYVDALLPLIERAIAQRPRFAARRSLVDTLASFGLGRGDEASARVAAALASLTESR